MRRTLIALAGIAVALAASALRAQDDEPKPNPYVVALKAAVGKGGKPFLAELNKDEKLDVALWKDGKVLQVVADPKTGKAGDAKEAAAGSEASDLGQDVGAAVAKAKVDMVAAVEKALQGESKATVELAQAMTRDKNLYWLVQIKNRGVGSQWEVDAETGKLTQAKPPGAAGDAPR